MVYIIMQHIKQQYLHNKNEHLKQAARDRTLAVASVSFMVSTGGGLLTPDTRLIVHFGFPLLASSFWWVSSGHCLSIVYGGHGVTRVCAPPPSLLLRVLPRVRPGGGQLVLLVNKSTWVICGIFSFTVRLVLSML